MWETWVVGGDELTVVSWRCWSQCGTGSMTQCGKGPTCDVAGYTGRIGVGAGKQRGEEISVLTMHVVTMPSVVTAWTTCHIVSTHHHCSSSSSFICHCLCGLFIVLCLLCQKKKGAGGKPSCSPGHCPSFIATLPKVTWPLHHMWIRREMGGGGEVYFSPQLYCERWWQHASSPSGRHDTSINMPGHCHPLLLFIRQAGDVVLDLRCVWSETVCANGLVKWHWAVVGTVEQWWQEVVGVML